MTSRAPKHVWLKHFGIVPVLDRDLDDVAEYERQYRMFGMVRMDAILGDTSANRARSPNAGEGVDAPIPEDRLPYYERRRRELHRIYESPEVRAQLEERRRVLAEARERDLEAWQERRVEQQRWNKERVEYLAEKKRRDEEWERTSKQTTTWPSEWPSWDWLKEEQRARKALRLLKEKQEAILREWHAEQQEKNDDSKKDNDEG